MRRLESPGSSDQAQPPPADGKIALPQFLVVGVQLGLLALIIRQFEIESNAFLRIVLLAFGGFVVHAFLPLRYRLPFFVALSLAAIGLVFGLKSGAWLVGIGLVLIGVCHLPVSFRIRAALLVLVGAVLAVLRGGWIQAPWSHAIWPILGSMFMFRLIVYLYDLAHEKAPVSVWRTLAYFFLLPNICFPLFPVVDYKTFRRNYYDVGAYRVYQVGVDWIARGIIHLILYRTVYYYFTLAPSEVANPADLAQYMLSGFLLYLRVSGQFHVIVGILLLFGFNLPETHHKYYLASSFTDFWRRINIYWKDFMLKIFYYPVYFKLRVWGSTTALVVSTLFVFLMTWLLHGYQWFWLRGQFPLTWQDVLFWGALALLVIGNALYETRFGRSRTLSKQPWSFRRTGLGALRTLGTFAIICVLWSLWTSESVSSWASLWTGLGPVSGDRWMVILLIVGVLLGATVWHDVRPGTAEDTGRVPLPLWRAAVPRVLSLAVLSIVGLHSMYSQFPPAVANVIGSLRAAGLSRVDDARLERGYYEALLDVNRFNGQLWEVYLGKSAMGLDGWEGRGLFRFRGDFLQVELVPSIAVVTRYGTIRTNRWGMRDQDYEKAPRPDTYRIAVLGSSGTMGWGVGDQETFEALVESRLNRERAGKPFARYELLNFAAQGYYPLQQVQVLDKALGFQPNAVLYVAAGREPLRTAKYLVEAVQKRLDIPYEYLRDMIRVTHIEPGMEETAALRRVEPLWRDILSRVYRDIVERSRERGVVPLWAFLPTTMPGTWGHEITLVSQIARDAGFVIIDLSDAFGKEDLRGLQVADWDTHPNARGHQLIAGRLYQAIVENEEMPFRPGADAEATNRGPRETERAGNAPTGIRASLPRPDSLTDKPRD